MRVVGLSCICRDFRDFFAFLFCLDSSARWYIPIAWDTRTKSDSAPVDTLIGMYNLDEGSVGVSYGSCLVV